MAKKQLELPYIFFDIKANGYRPTADRITEIALLQINEQQEKIWHQSILTSENVTNISLSNLKNAVTFQEIAPLLSAALEKKVLVANNARIKYGLLKNEMKRAGITISNKVLCFNQLLQNFQSHLNNKSFIFEIQEKFNNSDIFVDNLKNLADVFKKLSQEISQNSFSLSIKQQIKQNAIPSSLTQTIKTIPELPGIYQFYNGTGTLLYVGKSNCLRQRVKSHFSGDHANNKEMQLTQQTKVITWLQTCGEMGALLKEAQLIKTQRPIFNRMLRRYRQLFTFYIYPNSQNYQCVKIIANDETLDLGAETTKGLFKRRFAAKQKLEKVMREFQLCPKLMGLETGMGACFYYHIHRCLGACIGKEEIASYNARLQHALQIFDYKAWPFSGRIAIEETCTETHSREYHVIDDWCYLGTVVTVEEARDLLPASQDHIFDLDIYKIISGFLLNENKRKRMKVIFLNREEILEIVGL